MLRYGFRVSARPPAVFRMFVRHQAVVTIGFVGAVAVLLLTLTDGQPVTTWLPWLLAVIGSMMLGMLFGVHGLTLGWAAHVVDETRRTMGNWKIEAATAPSGDLVTVSGRMVYDDPDDVGRLNQFVHIELGTEE